MCPCLEVMQGATHLHRPIVFIRKPFGSDGIRNQVQFLSCRAVRRSWTGPLPRAVPEQLAAHFFLGLQSLPRSSFLHWGSVKDSAKTRLTLWMSLESRIVPGKRRRIFLIATCAADLDFLHGFGFSKATIIHYKKEIFRAFC